MLRRWCCLLAVSALCLAGAPAWAADAPIYKCLDSHLGLVYTDVPCKDGEQLDIRAGDADPKAVARLDRALDQLDQSAAQRMLDERHATDWRASGGWLPRRPEDDMDTEPASSAPYAYGYGYGYLPYPPYVRPVRHRPHRSVPVPGHVPAVPHLPKS
jgi:hypothetical protein